MQKWETYLRCFLGLLPSFQAVFRAAEAQGLVSLEDKWSEPVLDLGCGDGIFGSVFLGRGRKIVGFDLNQSALDQAIKRGIYASLIQGDARKLPFSDNTFASVLANSSLEHMTNLEQVLKEIQRVVRRGGRLVLSAPSEKREKYFLLGKGENWFFKHINCWSGKTWVEKLKNVGFSRVEYQYVGSRTTCLIGDLLLPLGLVGFMERKIFGRYLGWRKLIAPFLFLLLRNYQDRVVKNRGAVIIVKAIK